MGLLNYVFAYLLHPYRVIGEVPADTLVLVVGVHTAGSLAESWAPVVLALFPACVLAAAAANVLTATAYPFGGGPHEGEHLVGSVVPHSHHCLAASARRVRPAVLVSVLVEVLPSLSAFPSIQSLTVTAVIRLTDPESGYSHPKFIEPLCYIDYIT